MGLPSNLVIGKVSEHFYTVDGLFRPDYAIYRRRTLAHGTGGHQHADRFVLAGGPGGALLKVKSRGYEVAIP